MIRGMDVYFSEAHSDADTDIKNAISHETRPQEIRVVTSDASIQRFVRSRGATVIEAAAFLDEVEESLRENAPPPDEPIEKYEGGVGEDKDYWLRVFGGDEQDG